MGLLKHILWLLLLTAGLWSCGNVCRNVECANGGECFEGDCLCAKWYSGVNCKLSYNRNYEGEYKGEGMVDNRRSTITIELKADTGIANRMWIENGPYFNFETDSTLIFPTQQLTLDDDTLIISGSGTYGLDHMNLLYGSSEDDPLSGQPSKIIFNFSGERLTVGY